MSNDVKARFTMEDQAPTAEGTGRMATVTHLYREDASPRNMTPSLPTSHHSAPPPVSVPYGWRLVETSDGWLLQHEPAEWNVICRAVAGKQSGRPYHQIAAELHAEGAPVRNEAQRPYGAPPQWHAERLRRLVIQYAPELQEPRESGKTRTRSVNRTRPRFDIDTDEGFDQMARAAAIVMGEIPAT